jgi:hypothetical protein
MRPLAIILLGCVLLTGMGVAQDYTDWVGSLADVRDELLDVSPNCATGDAPPIPLMRRIRSFRYDTDAVNALEIVLADLPEDLPQGETLFIVGTLVAPLEFAPPEVVSDARDLIRDYLAGADYAELPSWTEDQLIEMHPTQTEDESDSAFALRVERAGVLLAEKLVAEQDVAFTNAQVHALRLLRVKLLLKIDDDDSDQTIIDIVKDAIENRDMDFANHLASIRAREDGMTQERAGWFYDQLKALWPREPNTKLLFSDFSTVQTNPKANPAFATENIKPVDALLKTINHLATIAKKPALKIR